MQQLFRAVLNKLEALDAKVSLLLDRTRQPKPLGTVMISSAAEKTLMVLKASATPLSAAAVAAVTGRSRACEARILNEFWRTGLAEKTRQGHTQRFRMADAK